MTAVINRLGQRIKENFQESTRDFNLLAGGGGSSTNAYFDASDDKMAEISKLLESRIESERLEGMKRIIAAMSKGRNMERFFAQVVKNVVANTIEIRKLVYIYLLRYASTNSDLLLLSINTFQKDLSDPSPLIRSMSLRVLTSIRVPVIQGIVMLGLKKLVNDRNPWVRKTVAGGLAKVYDMDSTTLPELIPLLQSLFASPSPLTLGATLTVFSEVCPDRLDLLHPYFRHICQLMVDADDWGQVVAVEVLMRYARAMLEKPQGAGNVRPEPNATRPNGTGDLDDEFEGLDVDLAMLLHHAKSLFHSRNPAVVLATAKLFFYLAPATHVSIGQDQLVAPLLRLAGGASRDQTEIAILTWDVIGSMAEERPWLFDKYYSRFFLYSEDPTSVKNAKLNSMVSMVNSENVSTMVREFKHYVKYPQDPVAEKAVQALGHCVRTQPTYAEAGLKSLVRLLKSERPVIVAQAVIVLKSVILSTISVEGSSPRRLVARLAKQLDNITNASARASVFWLVGQFAADDDPDTTMGLKWDGLAPWVPDVLRKGVKGFVNEEPPTKLQILTLASKLLVLSPATAKLAAFCQYLFTLARYDSNYDVRDRARFLHGLLRGVQEKNIGEEGIEDENEAVGGVTLRREQAKVILLGNRQAVRDDIIEGSEFDVGSMSRVTNRKLASYVPLPGWTDDPSDPSLRENRIERPKASSPVPQSVSYTPAAPMSTATLNVSKPGSNAPSPANVSPIGSVSHASRPKFRDLDDFLNSDSEEETDEGTESDADGAPAVGMGKLNVPGYEDDTEEETEEETEDEDEDGDEEGTEEETTDDEPENRPLYRRSPLGRS